MSLFPSDLAYLAGYLNHVPIGIGPFILVTTFPDEIDGMFYKKGGGLVAALTNACSTAKFPRVVDLSGVGPDCQLKTTAFILHPKEKKTKQKADSVRAIREACPPRRKQLIASEAVSYNNGAFYGDDSVLQTATGLVTVVAFFHPKDQTVATTFLDFVGPNLPGYEKAGHRQSRELGVDGWCMEGIRHLRVPV